MKKFLLIISVLLFVISGCASPKAEEPGNAFPVMAQYDGILYFRRGVVLYELPEDFEKAGEINCVETHSIAKDFDGNEEGYLYKNKDGELLFVYKEWHEITDGGKEPFLVLVPEE